MIRMRHVMLALLSGLATLIFQANAWAVTQTFGAGSAVSVVNGTADFESVGSLFDNPYLEGGMAFSRTDLSFNNNGCGYAGCVGHVGFVGFSGNYMYGTGNGYFEMMATGGKVFRGLEFTIGTGFFNSFQSVTWEAYSSGVLVGSGFLPSVAAGTIIGLSDLVGFDLLRYTDNGFGTFSAPAFDSVRAQFDVSTVPLPAALPLFATGIGLLGWLAQRRKQKRVGLAVS